MLLYKYIDQRRVDQIVEDEKLVFRSPLSFNDPLEMSAAMVPAEIDPDRTLDQLAQRDDGISPVTESAVRTSMATMNRLQFLGCVASCLTRTPVNPLMWAHYCANRGVVVGLDVSTDFFVGSHNLCPIQWGSMIYTETKPEPTIYDDDQDPIDRWYQQGFNPDNYERIQRAFLYKSRHWAYEEEVRIVKRAGEETEEGIREKIEIEEGELYLYSMPEGSVVELYFPASVMWMHHYQLDWDPGTDNEWVSAKRYFESQIGRGRKVFLNYPSERFWGLESEQLFVGDE